jgi:hypothetical protein
VTRPANQNGDRLQQDGRVDVLTTGFALGELNDAELSELYELLRQGGEAGERAAAQAWSSMVTHLQCRVALDDGFEQVVTTKLANDDEQFASRLKQRLGTRKGLSAVSTPLGAAGGGRPGRRLALLVVPALLGLLAAAAFLFLTPGSGDGPRIAKLAGSVTSEGRRLDRGPLPNSPVRLDTGAHLVLDHADGGRSVVSGPGAVSRSQDGIALLAGRIESKAVQAFRIGLPDLGLALEAGSHVVVEVDEGRSRVAVVSGSATRSDGTGQSTIAAGEWAPGSEATAPWMPSVRWAATGDGRWLPSQGLDPRNGSLHIEITTAERGATLGVDFETGRMTWWPGRLTLPGGEIIALSGAPFKPVSITISWSDGQARILVDGSAIGRFPVTSAPSSIRSAGPVDWHAAATHSGPAPADNTATTNIIP